MAPFVYRMAVAAERDGYWSLEEYKRNSRSSIPTVESIRSNGDLSDLLGVMLSTWRPGSPAPIPELRDTGLNPGFVDKIRYIRNACAHPFYSDNVKDLTDPEWVKDSEKASRDFAEIIDKIVAQRQTVRSGPAPVSPVASRPASASFTPRAGSSNFRRYAPQRGAAVGKSSARPAKASRFRGLRIVPFLLRPEFLALAGAAVVLIVLDFWRHSGIPESGGVWKAPLTVGGIVCALLALGSGWMEGRAVRVTAIISLMMLPAVIVLFVLYMNSEMQSDGFAVVVGGVMVLWAAVTALMPVISVLRLVGSAGFGR